MAEPFLTATFEGGTELVAALRQLGDEALGRRVMLGALKDVAEPLADEMQAQVDRRTGRLAESVKRYTIRDEEYEAAIATGPGMFWGWFEEIGTSRQAADPFVRPAFDTWRPRALEELGRVFWQRLARAARRLAKMR